jgi:predicted small metal-binding protein
MLPYQQSRKIKPEGKRNCAVRLVIHTEIPGLQKNKIGMTHCLKRMPSFVCFAKDGEFQTSAPTEAELMTKIAKRAKTAHTMDPIPPAFMAKVKATIKK